MPATPSFCLSFICSRDIIAIGRQMMMTSVNMLTLEHPVSPWSLMMQCRHVNVQKIVIQ